LFFVFFFLFFFFSLSDCMISHGAAQFLREKLFSISDKYRIHLCDLCGLIAIANLKKNVFQCKGSDAETAHAAQRHTQRQADTAEHRHAHRSLHCCGFLSLIPDVFVILLFSCLPLVFSSSAATTPPRFLRSTSPTRASSSSRSSWA